MAAKYSLPQPYNQLLAPFATLTASGANTGPGNPHFIGALIEEEEQQQQQQRRHAPPSWDGGVTPPPNFWVNINSVARQTGRLTPTIDAAIKVVEVGHRKVDPDGSTDISFLGHRNTPTFDMVAWHTILQYLSDHRDAVSVAEQSFIVANISPHWWSYPGGW